MYITDWFATLLGLAGLSPSVPKDMDSKDMWPSISRNKRSPRQQIVLNLDQDNLRGLWSAAIIHHNYKLLWGQPRLLKAEVMEECNLHLVPRCPGRPVTPSSTTSRMIRMRKSTW